jgi:aminoglycoside phosphotransferase family enzyme/predicted kinase
MATLPVSNEVPDQLARALAHRSAWSIGGESVEWIQTHISHVFLVGPHVYKLRKAVRLPFLDFSTRDARNADCLREVELNRRLAPSVYLGVAPLLQEGSTVRIGSIGEAVNDPNSEHVVVMRRLTAGRDALSLVEQNRLGPDHLAVIARLLQRFHDANGLGRPAPWSEEEWLNRIARPVVECLTSLSESELVPTPRLQALEARIEHRLESLRSRFEERRLEGRAVDAHGDLHLDHAWFEERGSDPLLIDCIEFNEDLRRIDRASEVAFLSMDLRYRGRADLGEWFLSEYASLTDDHGLFPVVDFYAAYRALVRAKVAAIAGLQTSITDEQRGKARTSATDHLSLAESLIEVAPSSGIILLCGTVGSGKSTVARHLAQSLGGIPIASDRVRKVLSGLEASAHAPSAPDEGIYRPERVEEVYRELLERASPVIESGRTAILDASYSKRAERDEARRWAGNRGLPIRLIEVRCRPEVALERLRMRTQQGTDPSDAGPGFLATSQARFESPDEWPEADLTVVSSDNEKWKNEVP